jgi:hypothetical protein
MCLYPLIARSPMYRRALIGFVISVRLFVRMYHRTDFLEIFYCETLRKSVEYLKIWLTSNKNIRHFTWRSKYLYIVVNITKYFVALKQCKEKPFLRVHCRTQWFYIVDSYKKVNNQRKRTVAFPLQQQWSERATILSYT